MFSHHISFFHVTLNLRCLTHSIQSLSEQSKGIIVSNTFCVWASYGKAPWKKGSTNTYLCCIALFILFIFTILRLLFLLLFFLFTFWYEHQSFNRVNRQMSRKKRTQNVQCSCSRKLLAIPEMKQKYLCICNVTKWFTIVYMVFLLPSSSQPVLHPPTHTHTHDISTYISS